MSGIILTNEREYTIIILLIYLIYNTKEKILKIITSILLITHIYKLYNNFELNYEIYKNEIKAKVYNIILFISVILFIFYPNNTNYLFLFSVLYVVTSILTHKILKESENYNIIKSNPIIPHIVTILVFSGLIIIYPNYKFKYLFWVEIIDHILTFILF
tara:strand:- start:1634 stop:2110 length:477 start_codon:yes stop_codon:yes gene_type:complete